MDNLDEERKMHKTNYDKSNLQSDMQVTSNFINGFAD